jgi:hypothetical protein
MFGDNQAVVNSLTLPEAKLHKRHTLLSYHRIHEAIATKVIVFIHIDGCINPADILSKHWGNRQVWESLQPLLFWSGDTIDTVIEKHGVVFEEEEKSFVNEGKFKTVVDSNGQGVLDFPKPQDTRVGHDSDMVSNLSTNMNAVRTGVRLSMDIHGGADIHGGSDLIGMQTALSKCS